MQNNRLSDAVLVDRIKAGDRSALDDLIRLHQGRAYQFAFRLTRNVDDASDIVANAFYRVNRSIGAFKGHCAFTTWLYRIISNCYFDLKKKEEAQVALRVDDVLETAEGDSLELQIRDEGPSAFDELLRQEKNMAISEAVENLPDYQKTILVMYHLELMSYEEIAVALDLPLGTVKSRLNRARCSLSAAMTEGRLLFDESDSPVPQTTAA